VPRCPPRSGAATATLRSGSRANASRAKQSNPRGAVSAPSRAPPRLPAPAPGRGGAAPFHGPDERPCGFRAPPSSPYRPPGARASARPRQKPCVLRLPSHAGAGNRQATLAIRQGGAMFLRPAADTAGAGQTPETPGASQMTDAALAEFRALAQAMQTEATDWEWIGPHMSQRMFGITRTRAEAYAARHGGQARQMG
jgi:hypothetical protein